MISWNAQGINAAALGQVLDDLNAEYRWEILLLQEASKYYNERGWGETWINGHLIFPVRGFYGRKPLAIALHSSIAGGVQAGSFRQDGSSAGLAINIRGQLYWVMTAHLDAYNSDIEFRKSLETTQHIVDLAPRKALRILGLDAQAGLGLAGTSTACTSGPIRAPSPPAAA